MSSAQLGGSQGGECLCPSGQGRAPPLRPRRQPQAMRWGNATSKQAGRVRSEESGAGWTLNTKFSRLGPQQPHRIISYEGTGEGWQQNPGLSPGVLARADPCSPLLSLIYPITQRKALRAAAGPRAGHSQRVESWCGSVMAIRLGQALLRAGPSSPWPASEALQAAPMVFIHFQEQTAWLGGLVCNHSSPEQARQTHHACPWFVQAATAPRPESPVLHGTSTRTIAYTNPKYSHFRGHRDPHAHREKRNSKEATSRGRFVNQPKSGAGVATPTGAEKHLR